MSTAQVTFAVERCGATGSHVMHAQPFPAFFSYYSSSTKCSTVVQVPWLPEVTEGHVTQKGIPLEGCAHAQPEVAQYPP